ncbi:hypothetical protein DIS09_15995 [Burkholderia pseudomallei]|nr:hypothetical protein AQ959_02560 [Burkholderia pseudomallei]TPE97627.1 hypothetical protein DIS09_15995 [Burkholderia pseudomallei]
MVELIKNHLAFSDCQPSFFERAIDLLSFEVSVLTFVVCRERIDSSVDDVFAHRIFSHDSSPKPSNSSRSDALTRSHDADTRNENTDR